MEIGKGVSVAAQGNILTIQLDMSKNFGKSRSGKSIVIATTEGNKGISSKMGREDNVYLGVNCYKYENNKPE